MVAQERLFEWTPQADGLPGANAANHRAQNELNPAFTENRKQAVHRWVPWIAGFSASFVDECIDAYLPRASKGDGHILDPFAGVGTTLLAGAMAGHATTGFEINPYAALASKVKTQCLTLDPLAIDAVVGRYLEMSAIGSKVGDGSAPSEFATRIPFFSPQVQGQVYGFWKFADSINDQRIADLFRVAFGATMVSFSNYTYEPSLGTRPGAGKELIENADVHGTLIERLRTMIGDIRTVQAAAQHNAPWGDSQVILDTFMNAANHTPCGFASLVVTSPPYMNNYHYIRNTRPQLFWLGLVGSRLELKQLEEKNIGKYWQTVRTGAPVELFYQCSQHAALIERIRSTRTDKGPYGGPGWANYAASYFNDTWRFVGVMKRSLARRGTAVIVIGNSIIQGHDVRVDEILCEIGEMHRLEVVGNKQLRSKRTGDSITASSVRRGEPSQARLYESAVVLRKK